MQSKVCVLQQPQALGGGAGADGLDVAGRQQLADGVALHRVVLDDQHPPHGAGELRLPGRRSTLGQVLALDRLDQVADRAERQRGLAVVGAGDDVDRDVAGLVVALQPVEHREARLVGQADVEHDGAGPVAAWPGPGPPRRCRPPGTGSPSRAPGRARCAAKVWSSSTTSRTPARRLPDGRGRPRPAGHGAGAAREARLARRTVRRRRRRRGLRPRGATAAGS